MSIGIVTLKLFPTLPNLTFGSNGMYKQEIYNVYIQIPIYPMYILDLNMKNDLRNEQNNAIAFLSSP
jgi:hypothetical protein